MKPNPAVSLAMTLARVAGMPAAQVAPAFVPPPSSAYFGDYRPPLRYLLALSGRSLPWIAPGRVRRRTKLWALWG